MIQTWRDWFLAPGANRGEAEPASIVKAANIGLALLVLITVVWFSMTSLAYNWNWSSVWEYRVTLFLGWCTTIGLTAAALVLSLVGGFLLALAQRTWFLPLRYFAKVLVEVVRCMPLLVLIYLVWYGIGGLLNVREDSRFIMGVLILALFEGAYISEIMRAGIESVGQSQIESARAIGLTRAQTYRYVIVPQAIRQTMPALVGQLVSLIKDSSLLSVIGITELTKRTQDATSNNLSSLEMWFTLALGYLVLTVPIALWSRWLERRFKYET